MPVRKKKKSSFVFAFIVYGCNFQNTIIILSLYEYFLELERFKTIKYA